MNPAQILERADCDHDGRQAEHVAGVIAAREWPEMPGIMPDRRLETARMEEQASRREKDHPAGVEPQRFPPRLVGKTERRKPVKRDQPCAKQE
jgi:hypothetical protein